MNITNSLRATAAGFVVAAVVAPTALAAGEPKNELRFTRQVTAAITTARHPAGVVEVQAGEPKNMVPFTRRVGTSTTASSGGAAAVVQTPAAGEPKNATPFTGTAPVPVEIHGGDGFDLAGHRAPGPGVGEPAVTGPAHAGFVAPREPVRTGPGVSDRVGAGLTPAPPTPPDVRVRIRRFASRPGGGGNRRGRSSSSSRP
jgi:hypothetical protein